MGHELTLVPVEEAGPEDHDPSRFVLSSQIAMMA